MSRRPRHQIARGPTRAPVAGASHSRRATHAFSARPAPSGREAETMTATAIGYHSEWYKNCGGRGVVIPVAITSITVPAPASDNQ